MSDQVLSYGPPVLTQQAADCALGLINFMATVVRGVDLINVTEEMRQIWGGYLANYYPMFAPADRDWVANAPATLAYITANWPQTPPATREMWRQTWAVTLPPLLQFIEPVLRAAQQQQQAWRNNLQNTAWSATLNTEAGQAQTEWVTFPQNANPEAELQYLLSHPGARVCPSPAGQTANGQVGAIAEIQRGIRNAEQLRRFNANFYGG